MSVFDKDLFGLSHYDKAILRLRTHCKGKKVLCSFSGGKDSQCCHQLLIDAGIEFSSQYSVTRFDPPELVDFIRTKYPDTIFRRAFSRSLIEDIEVRGLPSRFARWCCDAKHKKTAGFDIAVIGVRFEESPRRRKTWREFGFKDDKSAYCCPICDWTREEVWEYLEERGIDHCSLYDKGFARIGCVGCPLAGPKQMQKELAKYPKTAAVLRKGSDLHVLKMIEKDTTGSWSKMENPCEEIWQRWLQTGQTVVSINKYLAKWQEEDDQCLFDGTGFSETDGKEEEYE